MTGVSEKCGTTTGYRHHLRRGEKACRPCLDAQARSMAAWRKKRPDLHERNVADQVARVRALRELGRRHPVEFAELYRREVES